MKTHYIELIQKSNNKVIKRMVNTDKSTAEKICSGLLRNLNHEEYIAKVVTAEEDSRPLLY